jgi:hypothetical protein
LIPAILYRIRQAHGCGALGLAVLVEALEGGPAKQARGGEDETPDDDLVLGAVTLEAGGKDVTLFCVLADRQVVGEAEGARALGTRGRSVAALYGSITLVEERQGASAARVGRGPETDQSAVLETGTLAECRWCYGQVSYGPGGSDRRRDKSSLHSATATESRAPSRSKRR